MTEHSAAASLAATRLLLNQPLCDLSIKAHKLVLYPSIHFDSVQSFCRKTCASISQVSSQGRLKDGCTIRYWQRGEPKYLVLYNQNIRNLRRRNFTLAHELGHIYLEHRSDDPAQEVQANAFAAQLLMPEILVWTLAQRARHPLTKQDVQETFYVSGQAAQLALQKLHHPSSPDFAPLEKRLLYRWGGLLPQHHGPVITI